MKTNHYPQLIFAALSVAACMSCPLQAATTESNLNKSFSAHPGGQLIMDVDRGSIEITTADTSEVKIDVERKVTRESSSKAAEIFAAHEVTFDQDGDRVEVHAKFKKELSQIFNRGAQHFEVKYRVAVPNRFNLDLRTSAGQISSSDIEGNVKAHTAGGSLRFQAIKGQLDGTTSAGSIELKSATGPVKVRTSGGGIALGQLDSETSAETSAGSISIKKAAAKLTATTHGGSLELGELMGPSRVETSAGSIRVDKAQAQLAAITHGGRIEAGELAGPAELATSAGEIQVKVSHGTLQAKTSGGGIDIGDAQDTVTAHTSAGSISAKFSAQPHGDCELTTSGGGIVLTLAANIAFDLDAHTGGGQVITEVPVTTTVVGEHHQSGLKGKINGGGKALVLKTSAGNINIKKD
jgi:DUF4097 and DUF4098 domain-containing protein YvlB